MAKITGVDLLYESKRAVLLAIAAAHDGRLLPREIVRAAEDPRSPLHEDFEWDDSEAAEHYRLAQAGALVRRLRITVLRSDGVTKVLKIATTREFQSRPSQRTNEGGYEQLENILESPAKRAELIAQVLKEMLAYRHRYEALLELADVWNAIDSARAEQTEVPKRNPRRSEIVADRQA